jgi:sugar phosphate isomerase/epimerase
MPFILSTGSLWSYSLERCFAFASQAGFDGLELMVDVRWESRQEAYLKGLIQRHGLPVLALHSPFFGHLPGWPAGQPERIMLAADLAAALGAAVVVHHLPMRAGYLWITAGARLFPLPLPFWNPERGYRVWLEREYPALQPRLAAEKGVTLCIENMPAQRQLGRRRQWHHWNTLAAMSRFPAITLDTTHLGTWGLEPVEVYPALAGRVGHVHLSNFNGQEHRRPEDGRLRLDAFLTRLAADGYAGAVSLELQPDVLAAGQPDEVVVGHLANSLAYCRQAVRAGLRGPTQPL